MGKKILVVVDMQKDFVDGALGTKEAVAIVDNVVKKIEGFDGQIIVTYDTHHNDYMNTREGRYLPVPHCIKDTDGWKLNEKVQKALDEKHYIQIYKPTFGSTKLVERLKYCDPSETEVILCGLCTSICIISNAMLLKAHYPEMDISVYADACACVTPDSHKSALVAMKMCQINIINE